jgi:hypothetical protein
VGEILIGGTRGAIRMRATSCYARASMPWAKKLVLIAWLPCVAPLAHAKKKYEYCDHIAITLLGTLPRHVPHSILCNQRPVTALTGSELAEGFISQLPWL